MHSVGQLEMITPQRVITLFKEILGYTHLGYWKDRAGNNWFRVETPVGEYNPDWVIVKHDGQAIYLVRETKSTCDFLKLRTIEADKVRCGKKHFEALGMDFKVAVTAGDV